METICSLPTLAFGSGDWFPLTSSFDYYRWSSLIALLPSLDCCFNGSRRECQCLKAIIYLREDSVSDYHDIYYSYQKLSYLL